MITLNESNDSEPSAANMNTGTAEGIEEVVEGEGVNLEPDNITDLSELFASGPRLIVLQSNPLRAIAEDLRNELHEFIHTNLVGRADAQIGFDGHAATEINYMPILRACAEACQKLESFYGSDGGPEMVDFRGEAHGLQTQLEKFILIVSEPESPEPPSDAHLRNVLANAIQLKVVLANIVLADDMSGPGPNPAA